MEKYGLSEKDIKTASPDKLRSKIRAWIQREQMISKIANEIYEELGVGQIPVLVPSRSDPDYEEIKAWERDSIIRQRMTKQAKSEILAELDAESEV